MCHRSVHIFARWRAVEEGRQHAREHTARRLPADFSPTADSRTQPQAQRCGVVVHASPQCAATASRHVWRRRGPPEPPAADEEPLPRWDVEGFNSWADACSLAWVRVGYLRELHACGMPIPYRQLAANGSLWLGSPPMDVQLYAVSPYTWLGDKGDREKFRRHPTSDEKALRTGCASIQKKHHENK